MEPGRLLSSRSAIRALVYLALTSARQVSNTRNAQAKVRLNHLETRQVAIGDVVEVGQHSDLIVCTGVLHHLADPDAGLRALRSVLKPDGAMYLMVYASYGRTGVYMFRDYRHLGIRTSPQEINDLIPC